MKRKSYIELVTIIGRGAAALLQRVPAGEEFVMFDPDGHQLRVETRDDGVYVGPLSQAETVGGAA